MDDTTFIADHLAALTNLTPNQTAAYAAFSDTALPPKPEGDDFTAWGVHKVDDNPKRESARATKANKAARWMMANVTDRALLRALSNLIQTGRVGWLSVEAEWIADAAEINRFGSWDSWGMFGCRLASLLNTADKIASDAAGETDPFEGFI